MKYLLNIYEHKTKSNYTRTLNETEFSDILNKFCKDFSFDDTPIYKGIKDIEPYKIVNPKSI